MIVAISYALGRRRRWNAQLREIRDDRVEYVHVGTSSAEVRIKGIIPSRFAYARPMHSCDILRSIYI